MTFDAQALADLAAELDEAGLDDLTNPSAIAGRPLPEAGATRLRLISYRELGRSESEFTQPGGGKQKKISPKVELEFELSGPKHPPMEFDGVKVPHTLKIRTAKGTTVKNGYIKLFKAMTGDEPSVKNFVQLVGQAFRGVVVIEEFKRLDGSPGKKAKLQDANGYTIKPTSFEDPETGEVRNVKVDAPISPLSLFLWDKPSLAQWDSLYIDGTWDNGDSKNEHQETIKRALNFDGSPIQQLLIDAGREDELALAQYRSKKPASTDPLGDASGEGSDTPSDEDKAAEAAAAAQAKKAAAKALADAEAAKEAAAAAKPKAPTAAEKKAATKKKAEAEASADDPVAAAAKQVSVPPTDDDDDDEEAALAAALAAAKARKAAKAAATIAARMDDPLNGIGD